LTKSTTNPRIAEALKVKEKMTNKVKTFTTEVFVPSCIYDFLLSLSIQATRNKSVLGLFSRQGFP
jgi:hypothetical protein